MSDSGSGGLSGTFEFIGEQAKKGVQGAGNVAKSAVSTAAHQVTGTGGVTSTPNISGSFDIKPGGAGGSVDLFAPDAQKPMNNAKQMFGNTKPLTQAGHNAITQDRVYTQEELEKIQAIEAELKSMHAKNNNLEADMEKVRREREEKYQQRLQGQAQKDQAKQMQDLEQQPGGKVDMNTFKAARGTELAKGDVG